MGRRIQGENGYIKLYRSTLDWEWFDDGPTTRLWIYILLRANYEPDNYRGIELNRGEFLATQAEMAEATGLSRQSVRSALNHLKSTGEIDTEVTRYGTLVTVHKYAIYQSSDDDS